MVTRIQIITIWNDVTINTLNMLLWMGKKKTLVSERCKQRYDVQNIFEFVKIALSYSNERFLLCIEWLQRMTCSSGNTRISQGVKAIFVYFIILLTHIHNLFPRQIQKNMTGSLCLVSFHEKIDKYSRKLHIYCELV